MEKTNRTEQARRALRVVAKASKKTVKATGRGTMTVLRSSRRTVRTIGLILALPGLAIAAIASEKPKSKPTA